MGYTKKNVVPQGYGIRKATIQRFSNYAKLYSSQSGNRANVEQIFAKTYGNTYWYYLHFINNRASSNEAKHLFN